VPYAAPPFGPGRFALPQPVPPWSGTRDATRYGPSAPQNRAMLFADELPPINDGSAPDVLHVNVWAPAAGDGGDGGCPVLVWFHGGALFEGSNRWHMFDGTRFAEQGIVVVAANYRLGAEGFSVLDGAPLNLGVADQAAVLGWVGDEIAAFGGDPDRVTVAGQSAGGATVAALACSPTTRGRLGRAIVQSGPLDARPPDEAAEITRRMAHELDLPATREAFAGVAPADLLAAQAKVLASAVPVIDDLGFHIAVDGDLVPAPAHEALTGGAADAVPLLIGVTSEEHMMWMGPTGVVDLVNDETLLLVADRKGLPDAVVDAYRRSRPGSSPGDILGRLLSDQQLRSPMVAAADARAARTDAAPTFVYEFAWRSPVHRLGAGHSVELPFVFATLGSPEGRLLVGTDDGRDQDDDGDDDGDRDGGGPPEPLAEAMNGAWGRFVRGEAPGWPAWDPTRPVQVFDGAGDPVVHDRHPLEREAMAAAVRNVST
jgi:para-nitrobenzyl esterase